MAVCLPAASSPLVFSDAQCSRPLGYYYPCTPPAQPHYVSAPARVEIECTDGTSIIDDGRTAIYSVRSTTHVGPIFSRTGSSCSQAPGSWQAYATVEIEPADLVERRIVLVAP